MKKLLISLFLISNLSFGQETAYHLNGISTSNYDCFLSADSGIYYVNLFINEVDFTPEYSISYSPKSGQPGWKKNISVPANFYSGKSAIAACNLSNHFIVSIQPLDCSFCLVMKIDPNGNIIWSKLLSYSSSMGDYGSNSTPLTVNDQDEITVSLTSINNLILSKLDPDGNLMFSKRFNNPGFEDSKNPGFSIIATNDGGYLATMKAGDNPTITKLNPNLQVIWAKKWSIDSYSHPKQAIVLPNNNYCIIGTGDNGTYIAHVDPNGNLLSYKYNVDISYPFQHRVVNSDSILLVDGFGNHLKMNLSDNTASISHSNYSDFGIPNYSNGKMNLFNYYYSMIYLDLESSQMGCFNPTSLDYTLSELNVYPGSIVNDTLVMEDNGIITDYYPTITTSNNVSMTLTCGTLGIEETDRSTLKLHPNPSVNGQTVTIELEKLDGTKFQILTLSGKLIDSYETNGTLEKVIFNAPQQSGMYFVQVLDAIGNVIAVEKLVVE